MGKTEFNHNIGNAHSLQPGNADQHKSFYGVEASDYDYRYGMGGWACPFKVAETACVFLSMDAKIVDLGCGTGLLGEAMRNAGFSHVVGADISKAMLEKAREKNVYRDTFLHDIYAGPLPTGAVAIVMSGAMTLGHMDARMMPNIVGSLETGGFFIFSAPCTHEYEDEYIGSKASSRDFMTESGIAEWLDSSGALEEIVVTPDYRSMSYKDQILYHRNYVYKRIA